MKLNFAENLRTLRRTKNLTQEQLANLLAVSITYPDVELLGVKEAVKEQQINKIWKKLNRTDSSMERIRIKAKNPQYFGTADLYLV